MQGDSGALLRRMGRRPRKRLVQQRVEQAAESVITRGEACFQAVAHCHQLIDLGDDAVLFSQERTWNQHVL